MTQGTVRAGRNPNARRLGRFGGALLAFFAIALTTATPATATPAKINGSGSSYVALAMQQWVSDGQTRGLPANYTPTSSPQGLEEFGTQVIDFAGTEAEYSALGAGTSGDARGYQYVPDVAGAVAIMYNADDPSGKKNTTLHLSRMTIAKIFMGFITSWDDPAITADNKGYPMPAQPITVVYRTGQSGTTALFYDFVAHTDPADFATWTSQHQLPTAVRIISLPSNFAPKTIGQGGSDQIAQFVGSSNGKWSISYDEFGYAKTYNVSAAWVQNQSGNWVQPYAQNIASALKSAKLREDLSQELSGVYASPEPDAYPISAYSYMVTMCAPDPNRPTCKGPYPTAGVAETLTKWMRYIACDGQVQMAQIGYSPLPTNLSQEIAKSIGRMTGSPPEVLTADNCANPTFKGSIGGNAPPPADPLQTVAPRGQGPTAGPNSGPAAKTNGPVTTVAGASTNPGAVAAATDDPTAVAADTGPTVLADGRVPSNKAIVEEFRAINPVNYDRPDPAGGALIPLLCLLALVVGPPLVGGVVVAARRRVG